MMNKFRLISGDKIETRKLTTPTSVLDLIIEQFDINPFSKTLNFDENDLELFTSNFWWGVGNPVEYVPARLLSYNHIENILKLIYQNIERGVSRSQYENVVNSLKKILNEKKSCGITEINYQVVPMKDYWYPKLKQKWSS